jgi:hypothetical protein
MGGADMSRGKTRLPDEFTAEDLPVLIALYRAADTWRGWRAVLATEAIGQHERVLLDALLVVEDEPERRWKAAFKERLGWTPGEGNPAALPSEVAALHAESLPLPENWRERLAASEDVRFTVFFDPTD